MKCDDCEHGEDETPLLNDDLDPWVLIIIELVLIFVCLGALAL